MYMNALLGRQIQETSRLGVREPSQQRAFAVLA